MNFRTLIMLAIAALVIVVAIKMNRNPAVEPATQTTIVEETAPAADLNPDEVVVEEEAAVDMQAGEEVTTDQNAADVADPAITPENGEVTAPVTAEEYLEKAPSDVPADENAVNGQTDATVDGETMTEEEAKEMEPAVVNESPAEARETGPAEVISEEPVTEEKPATTE